MKNLHRRVIRLKPIHRERDGEPAGIDITQAGQEMERLHKQLLSSCSGRGKNPEKILKNLHDFLIAASIGDIAMRKRENLSEALQNEAVISDGVVDRMKIIVGMLDRNITTIQTLARNIRAMCEHAEMSPGKKCLGIEGLDEAITWFIHGIELKLPSQRKEVQ